jgi:metallo-beta-lactamase class B
MILKIKTAIAVLMLSLLSVLSQVFAQDRDSLAKNPELFLQTASKLLGWNEPVDPIKIAGPIYFVGTKGLAAYLITGSEGHILLYTAMPSSGPMIEASIRKLGFKTEDIKLLLTGHAHIDHTGGHAYIKISSAML